MDENLLSVLKTYGDNDDGFLTKEEFNKFCDDVSYGFTEQEREIFNLDSDQVSYDQIMGAIGYHPNDMSNEMFMSTLKSLDKDNSGKVFVPELINVLKHGKVLSDKNMLDELLLNLPIEDHHLMYNQIN